LLSTTERKRQTENPLARKDTRKKLIGGMPPPPPPSASYKNLIRDDDTTDDSDSDDDGEANIIRNDVEEHEPKTKELVENDDSTPSSPSKKKSKRKNKKKKRKKKKSKQNIAQQQQQENETKSVRFSGVMVREYERCLGPDVVPVDGGWPLGLSDKVESEYHIPAIDEFEQRRQEELRQRWLDVMSEHLVKNRSDTTDNSQQEATGDLLQLPKGPLETRQFDYKKVPCEITGSTKNPLFRPLSEEERMLLLVAETADDEASVASNSSLTASPKSPSRSNAKQARRGRSNSEQFSAKDSPKPIKTMRRLRSNSDQFYSNGAFTTTELLSVRNELEQVRVQRCLEGSTGCACRKLDVYIPPKDGGGKKAQHRRMNERKVKEELRKRGLLPDNSEATTRAELEQLLHDAVEKEPCCWNNDCVCVRNGLGCQADACSCWHDSHQRKGSSGEEAPFPSIETIEERCGNNMYVVDLDGISAFRKQFCQPVGTPAGV
jgi:hypothetical protein